MRRIVITTVSLLILLTLAGCTGNLFMEWDKPDVPSAEEINDKDVTSPSGAEAFLSDAEDWYAADVLSDDGETSEAVVLKLKEIYDDPVLDDETRQEAAALAGKVVIQSDPNAEQLSKNLIGSYDELSSMDSETDAKEFLKSIIPQEALDDPVVFAEMVNTLLQSSDAYLALGDSIDTDGPTYLSDAELGDAVQLGAVSVAVAAALDSMDGSLDGNEPTSGDISTLFDIVNDDASFSNDPTYDDPMNAFTSSEGVYSGMYYLLDAAGMSFN